jgi:hypothetical protein
MEVLASTQRRFVESGSVGRSEQQALFVPVDLPAPTTPAVSADIRIELQRGATAVIVTWPASAPGAVGYHPASRFMSPTSTDGRRFSSRR